MIRKLKTGQFRLYSRKKDAKTGKLTGFVGFGHPMPFTRYRLVITSVSKVEAVEKKQ